MSENSIQLVCNTVIYAIILIGVIIIILVRDGSLTQYGVIALLGLIGGGTLGHGVSQVRDIMVARYAVIPPRIPQVPSMAPITVAPITVAPTQPSESHS